MDDALERLAEAVGRLDLGDLAVDQYDVVLAAETLSAAGIAPGDAREIDDAAVATLVDIQTYAADWLARYNGEAKAQTDLWDALSALADSAHKAIVMRLQLHLLALLSRPVAPEMDAYMVLAVQTARTYVSLLRLPGAKAFGLFDAGLARRCLSLLKRALEVAALAHDSGSRGTASSRAPRGSGRAASAGPAGDAGAASGGSRPRRTASGAGAAAAKAADADDDDEGMARGGAAAAGPKAAASDDDDSDASIGSDGSDGDEEDAMARGRGRARRAPTRSASAAAAAAVAAPSGGDASTAPYALTATQVALLHAFAADTCAWLRDFALRMHPELLPIAVDALLGGLLIPTYNMRPLPASAHDAEAGTACYARLPIVPTPAAAAAAGAGNSSSVEAITCASGLLPVLASGLLCLLQPQHGPSLVTARVVCKKLKPLLLQGAPTASSIALSFGAGGEDDDDQGMGGGHGDDSAAEEAAPAAGGRKKKGAKGKAAGSAAGGKAGKSALGAAAAAAAGIGTRFAKPLDPRVMRARAVFLVRCLVGDNAYGYLSTLTEVVAADGTGDAASGAVGALASLPAATLSRLPAVAALLQHLCLAAVSAKADVRAHATDVIVQLRAALPHSLRRAFVRFLLKFGRSSRAQHRLFGVELAGRMLGLSTASGSTSAAGASTGSDAVARGLPSDAYTALGISGIPAAALAVVVAAHSPDGAAAVSGASARVTALASSSVSLSAVTYAESPLPTAAESALEAQGYGAEADEYIGGDGEEDEDGGATSAAGGAASGPSTPVAAGGRRRPRRSSICYLGMEGAATGAGATPARAASGRGATAARSPFYGTPGGVGGGGGGGKRRLSRRDSTSSIGTSASGLLIDASGASDDTGGCVDPRPTVIMLLDHVLHRSSDKSPAVRARALAILSDTIDAGVHHEAHLNATLLTHLAAMTTRVKAATTAPGADAAAGGRRMSVGGATAITGDGSISLGDLTIGAGGGLLLNATAMTSTGGSAGHLLSASGPLAAAEVALRPLTTASPLVPLLLRRLQEDGRPAVKKAALAGLTALASTGGCGVIICRALEAHYIAAASAAPPSKSAGGKKAAPAADDDDDDDVGAVAPRGVLARGSLVALHDQVLRAATVRVRSLLAAVDGEDTDGPLASAAAALPSSPSSSSASSAAGGGTVTLPMAPPSRVMGLYALQTLSTKGTDKSVLVRKAALAAFDGILALEPESPVLQRLWLATVLPLCFDTEPTAVAKAVEAVNNRIFLRIMAWNARLAAAAAAATAAAPAAGARKGRKRAAAALDDTITAAGVWPMLAAIAGNSELQRCLAQAVLILSRTVAKSTSASSAAGGAGVSASASGGVSLAASISFPAEGVVKALCEAPELLQAIRPARAPAPASGDAEEVSLLQVPEGDLRRGSWLLLELMSHQFLDVKASAALAAATATPALSIVNALQSAGGTSGKRPGKAVGPARAFVDALPFVVTSWVDQSTALKVFAAATSAASLAASRGSLAASGVSVNSAGTGNVTVNDVESSIVLHLPLASSTSDASAADAGAAASPAGAASKPSAAVAVDVETLAEDAARTLRVLALLAPLAVPADAKRIVTDLLNGVRSFQWDANLVAAALKALSTLTLCGCTTQAQATAATESWSSQVVAACEAGLLRYLSSRSLAEVQALAPAVTSVLFVIGELSLIALDAGSGQGVIDKHNAPAADGLFTGVSIKPSAVAMPARMTTLLQALLSRTMAVRADCAAVAAAADAAVADSAVASPDASTSATVPIPDAVRAHAYLCLGKLCLRDNALAKRYVTVFVRDLNPATSPAPVRNNILFVLGDLCVRYTALVDRYVPSLAACIADPHPLVRRHALQLLTQLVSEEYVKLRGPLFYRFATALSDGDEGVRRCAEAAMTGVFAQKYKASLTSHFAALAFVLTGCTNLPAYAHLMSGSAAALLEAEDAASAAAISGSTTFSAAATAAEGPALTVPVAARRLLIYRSLLAAMTDEQRLTVHGKLVTEILGSLAEGMIHLSAPAGAAGGAASSRTPAKAAAAAAVASSVTAFGLGSTELLVSDVLAILSSAEMRATSAIGGGATGGKAAKATGGADEEDADAEAVAAAAANEGLGDDAPSGVAALAAAAKSRLLGRLVRKHVSENVIPVCLGVRAVLSSARSPLAGALLAYFSVLFEDHNEEMTDALASDRTAAAELQFDLRIWREQQQAAAAARAGIAAAAAAAPDGTGAAATPRAAAAMPARSATTPMGKGTPAGAAAAARAAAGVSTPAHAGSRPAAPASAPAQSVRRTQSDPVGAAAGVPDAPATTFSSPKLKRSRPVREEDDDDDADEDAVAPAAKSKRTSSKGAKSTAAGRKAATAGAASDASGSGVVLATSPLPAAKAATSAAAAALKEEWNVEPQQSPLKRRQTRKATKKPVAAAARDGDSDSEGTAAVSSSSSDSDSGDDDDEMARRKGRGGKRGASGSRAAGGKRAVSAGRVGSR